MKHAHVLLELDSLKEIAPFYVIFFGAFCLVMVDVVAFQANFVQLGLDQLMDAPSENLRIFVHKVRQFGPTCRCSHRNH